jgi:hypothetical protein
VPIKPVTWEAEAGVQQVQDQPGLPHLKKKKKTTNK